MKRTVLIALGCIGLAAVVMPSGASAAAGDYNCYKAKDQKAPQFAGSTFDVTDEFGPQVGMQAKKPFLYCTKIGSSPDDILSCYKVKSPGSAADSLRTVTDGFGTVKVSVKKKSFVYCSPGTGS